jgi:hypothetical protein
MLRSITRRGVAALAAMSLLLFSVTGALAQADTLTIKFRDVTETFPDVNPCTGDPTLETITYSGVLHFTEDASGGMHITGTFTGSFLLDVTDPLLPDYTGRFTQWFGGNHNSNIANETVTFAAKGTGTDGSTLQFNGVAHITAESIDFESDPPTVSGLRVMFEKFRCH